MPDMVPHGLHKMQAARTRLNFQLHVLQEFLRAEKEDRG